MFTLYWSTLASSIAVHASLEQVKADYQLRFVDLAAKENRSETYLSLNPTGLVPALTLPNGRTIGEAAAAITLIGEMYPNSGLTPLHPDEDRSNFLFWLNVIATSGGSAGTRCGHPYRFASSQDAMDQVLERARADFDEVFDQLENAISGKPFFLASGLSGLDFYVTMYSEWHYDQDALFSSRPNVARLCEAVGKTDAYCAAMATHAMPSA